MTYTAKYLHGRPAVYDSINRSYCSGFATMREARTRAMELNEEARKNPAPKASSWRKTP